MRRWIGLALAVAVAVPVAWAGSLYGVDMPDEVTISGKTLVLNGMGVRKKLWIKVYVAGLYVEQKTSDPAAVVAAEGPKRVVMHFLTNKATKKRMDSGWDEGFEENSPDQMAALKRRIEEFKGYFGDMKVGDVVEYDLVPGEGTTIRFNGTTKGTIEGDDFAAALLRVWLGDEPPTEELKAGMLGQD